MNALVPTFLELARIDEVYPGEDEVLRYVSRRLEVAGVPFEQDTVGNIIARIPGMTDNVLGICAHVDIAAPLNGREVVIDGDTIGTDGKGLLGGDDKTAVAAMLELADETKGGTIRPFRPLELVFTVGEEYDMNGSRAIQPGALQAKDMLVFDWVGGVNQVIARSPARYVLDVAFHGKDAHPGQWQLGRNAGAAMMAAGSALQQGEYAPGVVFTIGKISSGDAVNKVPGSGGFTAEMRSFDPAELDAATVSIKQQVRGSAREFGVRTRIRTKRDPNILNLDPDGPLFEAVSRKLGDMGLKPNIQDTYGRFDANAFASRLGMNAVVLGAAYHNPHSPQETVSVSEFEQMYDFIRRMALSAV